jgi:CheY-like chemotaxis protein
MPRAHVMVVDDDSGVVALIQHVLEKAGFAVTAMTSGAEAIRTAQEFATDLIILDLCMPEPDGFEVMAALRSCCPPLKVLVMSGFDQGSLLPVAQAMGVAGVLNKPFSVKSLVGTVEALVV